jgi:hypothetical protein
MREIRFRAYIHGKMWEVIEWNFDGHIVGRQDILLRDDEGNELRELLKNLDLRQYTGLKDVNGKEIYEGDIVSLSLKPEKLYWPIKWEEDNGGFSPFAVTGEHMLKTMHPEDAEIVGNIWENPDLLAADHDHHEYNEQAPDIITI